MALIDLVSEGYVTQNIINLSSTSQLGQQLRVTGGGYGGAGSGTFVLGSNQQPQQQHHHQLITDAGGNLVQLINPISTDNSPNSGGLVLNYVVDQDGSQFPIYDTLPLVTGAGDGSYFTLMSAEPELEEVTSEPETPSHILDHMYAKKEKTPGSGPTRKRRKRSRKKEPAIQAAPEYVDILPNVPQANTTKINIIRKGFAASITNPNPSLFHPVPFSRPNILQNTRGSSSNVNVAAATPSNLTPTTISSTHPSKPSIVIPLSSSKSTKPTAAKSNPRKAAPSASPSATSLFVISSDGSNGPDELLQEDCFRQVDSSKEGELCFMLTSSSSEDPSKTDTNETVMMAATDEPHETDSLLSEFSICSFPDDQQMAGGAGTFLLDDKQIYLSYD